MNTFRSAKRCGVAGGGGIRASIIRGENPAEEPEEDREQFPFVPTVTTSDVKTKQTEQVANPTHSF